MPAPRHKGSAELAPELLDFYETGNPLRVNGSGSDVEAAYLDAFSEWHDRVCGRPECLRHRSELETDL